MSDEDERPLVEGFDGPEFQRDENGFVTEWDKRGCKRSIFGWDYGVHSKPVSYLATARPKMGLEDPPPPPPDDSWYDWPFDDVLGQIYDWFIANLTEIISVGEKIGQLLGLLRERFRPPAAAWAAAS